MPEKRPTLKELKAHPWLAGPVYSPGEIQELLHDQLDYFSNLARRRMQELRGQFKRRTGGAKSPEKEMDCLLHDKLMHDVRMSAYYSECVAINTQLCERAEEAAEPHNSSDDQVNYSSDESLKDPAEDVARTPPGDAR